MNFIPTPFIPLIELALLIGLVLSLSFCLSSFFAEHWAVPAPLTHKEKKSKLNKLSPRGQPNSFFSLASPAPAKKRRVGVVAPLAYRLALGSLGRRSLPPQQEQATPINHSINSFFLDLFNYSYSFQTIVFIYKLS